MGKRIDETYINFDLTDYLDVDNQHCRIVVLSDASINYLLSVSRYGHFSTDRWQHNGENVRPGTQAHSLARQFVGQTEARLIMACNDAEDMTTQLTRIADTLEQMNERQAVIYTWTEFISDLENAFGVGSIMVLLAEKTLGLMPNLRLKFDTTPILIGAAQSLIETHTRYTPLNRALLAIATELGIIAGVEAASKPLQIIQTLLAGFNTAISWTSFLTSGFETMFSYISTILGIWAGDEETIPDPDNDPSARVSVNIANKTMVSNIINACCAGLPDLPSPVVPQWITPSEQHNVDASTPPDADLDDFTWQGPRTAQSRCRSAHYVVRSASEFFHGIDDALGIGNLGTFALSNFVSGTVGFIAVMALPIMIPTGLLIALAGAILAAAAAATSSFIGEEIAQWIDDNEGDLACIFFNAQSSTQAQNIVRQIASDDLPAPYVEILLLVWNLTMLANLLYNNSSLPETGLPQDCNYCEGSGCSIVVDSGTGPSYPGGTYTSTTSDGQPSHNANVILSPNCATTQVVTINSFAPTNWQFSVIWTDPTGTPQQSALMTNADLPVQINIHPILNNDGGLQIYAGFTHVGSFQVNLTMEDL